MKIKIVSDGTATGTTVLCAETGEPLVGVQVLTFMASVDDEQTRAILELSGVQCEIVTEAAMDLRPDSNPFQVEVVDLDLLPDEIKDFFGNDDSSD